VSFVACGPEHDNLFEQLAHWWPDRRPPDYAEVVSPFFDVHDGPNRPASTLWKLLRHRGKATVTWHVSATRLSDDGPIVLHAPESLRSAMPKQRPGVATHFAHINEATKTDAGKDLNRPLHAKMISLFNTRWRLLLIGSSNFTSAGTGIANTPNVEANLVYWANQERESEAAKLIDQSILRGENADFGYTWQFDPRNEEQQEDHIAVSLPEFFEFAEFYFIQGKGYLRLRLGKVTPGDFLIYRPDSKEILYSFDSRNNAVASAFAPTGPYNRQCNAFMVAAGRDKRRHRPDRAQDNRLVLCSMNSVVSTRWWGSSNSLVSCKLF